MMLCELSQGYRESGDLVKMRIVELRIQLRTADDPEEIFHLRMRIAALKPMMQEMRDLAELTAHYYERGYHKNGIYTL